MKIPYPSRENASLQPPAVPIIVIGIDFRLACISQDHSSFLKNVK